MATAGKYAWTTEKQASQQSLQRKEHTVSVVREASPLWEGRNWCRIIQNDVRFVHPGIFVNLMRSPWMTCLPHQLWTFQGDGRPGMTGAEVLTFSIFFLYFFVKFLFCCVTLLFCTLLGFYAPETCAAGRLVRRAWAQSQVCLKALLHSLAPLVWFSHLCMLVELRAYYFWHMPTDTVQPMT